MRPMMKAFFDKATSTMTYIVYDSNTLDTVIIDPVWNFDQASCTLSTQSAEEILSFVKVSELNVHFILETHAHADHISAAQILKNHLPGTKIAIGENIRKVQETFANIFHLSASVKIDGSQFDGLLADGSVLRAGSLPIEVISTPGHTPACSSYRIGDTVFTGDALFMPDFGTGRCDFPGASAADLYDSIHGKLYQLPDDTRVFVGHDYLPGGRPLEFESTIGEEKKKNIHLREKTSKEEFVAFRMERDRSLKAPQLLFPSLQININAGILPAAESNGRHYLKLPIQLAEATS